MSEKILELNLNQKTNIDEDLSTNQEKASIIKEIIKSGLGYSSSPVSIKGNKEQISAFTEALQAEKQFLETYRNHGPDSEQINELKAIVEQKINEFERKTEIEWPLR